MRPNSGHREADFPDNTFAILEAFAAEIGDKENASLISGARSRGRRRD